ncbi:carbon-phosphorus lyase complex subunit PhnI [Undibacterium umbellatum]|uniref:Carbon-phosphorus lyase complex subunit PhnI n=1 Tax=Undibacterium umbellatum TaxID=2762300 RepID=A0ABR6Z9Z8_9BURK|nr:carbon-phosphorus lyase complex subunit PhnI [Undibacterium umbellatum]MBC3908498.1 carbon-phosphorus lyase complex subunit PhnI [Undibacterium umbellatum]
MYVAVKGGEKAIAQSYEALAKMRRGDTAVPELSIAQIREQMSLAVARVMGEASLYDQDLAALAIKQASGDLIEAIFLLRAYRTTLPRLMATMPVDTANMLIQRRISATFKDVPGGQVLGATYDYTQRLLDFSLAAEAISSATEPLTQENATAEACPRVLDFLNAEGLIEPELIPEGDPEPFDLTREPLQFPASRALRLQSLARGDEGFLLALAYSTQRGYARNHPFAGEIRYGKVSVQVVPEELGFAIDIGEIDITECQMVNQFVGSQNEAPKFTRGYGLGFGHCERKTMAMGVVDRALRASELKEEITAPAQMEEFVLYHADNVEASGFLQHLKLPHYVDFQAELSLLRGIRAAIDAKAAETGKSEAGDDKTEDQSGKKAA